MEVKNSVVPNEPGPAGPIWMVNLLKFRERAEYEDGRETDLSGVEAYGLYGKGVARLLKKQGGGFMFGADVEWLGGS